VKGRRGRRNVKRRTLSRVGDDPPKEMRGNLTCPSPYPQRVEKKTFKKGTSKEGLFTEVGPPVANDPSNRNGKGKKVKNPSRVLQNTTQTGKVLERKEGRWGGGSLRFWWLLRAENVLSTKERIERTRGKGRGWVS